ncbi:serine/arginine repetitive matrix protein 1-like [Hippoglossus hippoglossus]|uniref:serine/arginine repetitive matrix protein 1-like n=1 Tax=Hippoglossus hippoglossus TaxID=8267 RepID=UPI00148C91B1|nr:serine/arginine repetitive matrix protein 1-like [Hippoglossus hippoglossus]
MYHQVPKVQTPPQPRNVWKTDGPTLAKKMAETPPPARPFWTMDQSHTPLNSPPPKTPPQPRNFWKTDGPTGSHSPAKKMAETPPPARPFWTTDQSHTPVNSPPPKVIKIQTPPQPRHFWRTDAPTGPRSPARKVDHWANEDPKFEMPNRQRGAIWSVRASHSQNNDRYSAFSRNHQCTCMALTFLADHNEGLRFNTTHLDKVLEQGDSLYVGIKNQLLLDQSYIDDHLTDKEMPKRVLTDTNIYNVHMSSVRCGG